MPGSAAEALEARPETDGEQVPYREEIRHPALTVPVLAAGTFVIGRDGALIRMQEVPRRERSEIGDNFIAVSRPPEGEANLLPIPSEMAPMLATIRALVAGRPDELPEGLALSLGSDRGGWHVDLQPADGGALANVVVTGCGDQLIAIRLDQMDGTSRLIRFGSGP